MSDKNTEEVKNPQPKPKMRQVILETDGNGFNMIKNETVGNLELFSLLSMALNKMQQK